MTKENKDTELKLVPEAKPKATKPKAAPKAKAAAKPKAVKHLTPTDLRKADKKLDARTEITIHLDDTEFKLEVDAFFRPTKQQAVLDGMLKFYNQAEELGDLIYSISSTFTALLIVKEFTSLEVPNEFDEQLLLLNVLVDTGVLDQILEKLPEEELEKMYDLLMEVMSKFQENINLADEEIQRLIAQAEIENSEVLGLDKKEEEFKVVTADEFAKTEEKAEDKKEDSDKPLN